MPFAGIPGDINPVHPNHELASTTIFEGPIARGMLTASLISTVLGTKLPGPGCTYVSQDLRFAEPVRAGGTLGARVTVRQLVPERQCGVSSTVRTIGGRNRPGWNGRGAGACPPTVLAVYRFTRIPAGDAHENV